MNIKQAGEKSYIAHYEVKGNKQFPIVGQLGNVLKQIISEKADDVEEIVLEGYHVGQEIEVEA